MVKTKKGSRKRVSKAVVPVSLTEEQQQVGRELAIFIEIHTLFKIRLIGF